MFRPLHRITLVVMGVLILTSCVPWVAEPADQIPGLAGTLAAQTIQADDALKSLLNTATPKKSIDEPVIASLMPTSSGPATRTPVPSLTPIVTEAPAQVQETLIAQGVPCNSAEFVADVTIPDDSIVAPGQKFTKIWQLKNTGSCTWNEEYLLVLIFGFELGTKPPIPLSQVVTPGAIVDIAIDMVAPYIVACVESRWMLQDPQGKQFGTGEAGKNPFWVLISVWSRDTGVPFRRG